MINFKYWIIFATLIFSSVFLMACGGGSSDDKPIDTTPEEILVQSIDLDYQGETMTFAVHDTHNFQAIVEPQNADNKNVSYFIQNTEIAEVDPSTGEAIFKRSGITTLIIQSQDEGNAIFHIYIQVLQEQKQFDAPTNLHVSTNYDEEILDFYQLEWDEVYVDLEYYDKDGETFLNEQKLPQYYIVNIDGVEIQTVNNFFKLEDYGQYNDYSVKAVGYGEGILDSNSSTVLSARILNAPGNILNTEDSITWEDIDGAEEYIVNINGLIFETNTNALEEVDFSTAKNYEIYIYSRSDLENVFKSLNSEKHIVRRLETPTVLDIDGAEVFWSVSEHAIAYEVTVIDLQDDTQIVENVIENSYTLSSEIDSGDYAFKVRAIGNNDNILNSDLSIETALRRLESPENLRVENNKIFWDNVLDANSYTIKINSKNYQVFDENKFDITDTFLAGEYQISIVAHGANQGFISSAPTDNIQINKLNTPQIQVSSGQINWTQVSLVEEYMLLINDQEILVDSSIDSYSLGEEFEHGFYDVAISAIASGNIDSNFSSKVSVEKLEPPTNIRVDRGVLRWASSPRISEYIVSIAGDDVSTGIMNTFDLEGYNAGSYNIQIRSKVKGATNLIGSNRSPEFSVEKLAVPQSLRLDKGFFLFDSVLNSSGYKIDVNGEKIFTPDIDEPMHLDLKYSEEGYNVKVKASGDSESRIRSDYSESINLYQLNQIKELKVEDHILQWDEYDLEGNLPFNYKIVIEPYKVLDEITVIESQTLVLNSDNRIYTELEQLSAKFAEYTSFNGSYRAKVIGLGNNNNILSTSWTEYVQFRKLPIPEEFETSDRGSIVWDFVGDYGLYEIDFEGTTFTSAKGELEVNETLDPGAYNVRVRALGDGSNYIRSEFSTEKTFIKPSAPTNVRIEDGRVVWDHDSDVMAETRFIVKVNGVTVQNQAIRNFYRSSVYPFTDDTREYVTVYAVHPEGLRSDGTQPLEISKLRSPLIYIENEIIFWSTVKNATGYNLDIGIENFNVHDTEFTNFDLRDYLDTENVQPGMLPVNVQALGDNNLYIDSNFSNDLQVFLLDAPQGISIKDGALSWEFVDKATGYNIKIYNHQTEATSNVHISDPTETTYDLDENYLPGEYSFEIMSIGNETNVIDSFYSEPLTGEKMEKTTSVALQDGVLVFDEHPYATGNRLEIVRVGGSTSIVDLDPAEITEYILGEDFDPGEYEIRIMALGGDYYFNADYTVPITVNKLGEVSNFRIQDGIFEWSPVLNASSYIIKMDGDGFADGVIINDLGNITSYLPSMDDIPSNRTGVFTIRIRARGDSNTYMSGTYTENINFHKPRTLTHIGIEDGYLTWIRPSFITSGNFIVKAININTTQETSVMITDTDPGLELYDNDVDNKYLYDFRHFDPGEYTFRVMKAGTQGQYFQGTSGFGIVDSDISAQIELEKPERPSGIRIEREEGSEDEYLRWDSINVNKYGSSADIEYNVYIYGDSTGDGEYDQLHYLFENKLHSAQGIPLHDNGNILSDGGYRIFIRANGDNYMLVHSDLSDPYDVIKPVNPENIRIEPGWSDMLVKWDPSPYTDSYDVELTRAEDPENIIIHNVTDNWFFFKEFGTYIKIEVFSISDANLRSDTAIGLEFDGEDVIVYEPFEAGSGVPNDPYIIITEEQLMKARFNPVAHYKLESDLDFSTQAQNFIPIGDLAIPFQGVFDGNGKIISNIKINVAFENTGLFGVIAPDSTVKDLTIDSVKYDLSQSYTRSKNAGLIAGINHGTIKNIKITSGSLGFTNDVYDHDIYAGAVGINQEDALITGLVNNASIQVTNLRDGNVYAGGIAGRNNGSIEKSGNNLDASVSGIYAGGIAGFNSGTIVLSYNNADIFAYNRENQNAYAGGIAGFNHTSTDAENTAKVVASYNTGNVDGEIYEQYTFSAYTGGIVGFNNRSIIVGNFTLGGNVTATADNLSANAYAGMIAGHSNTSLVKDNRFSPDEDVYGDSSSVSGSNNSYRMPEWFNSTQAADDFNTYYLNYFNIAPDPENDVWTSVSGSQRLQFVWED